MQHTRIVLAMVCVALLAAPTPLVNAQNVFTDAYNTVANGVTSAFDTVRNGTVGAYETVANGTVGAYNTVANGTVGVYNDAVAGANRTAQNALGSSAEHMSAVRIGAIVAALPVAMWALL